MKRCEKYFLFACIVVGVAIASSYASFYLHKVEVVEVTPWMDMTYYNTYYGFPLSWCITSDLEPDVVYYNDMAITVFPRFYSKLKMDYFVLDCIFYAAIYSIIVSTTVLVAKRKTAGNIESRK